MTTFQLIIVVLATIYVFASLYFSISGRKLARMKDEKDDERYEKQSNYDEQLAVLTKRLGEIATENDRLNGVVRTWMDTANKYKVVYEATLNEKEQWQKEASDLQEQLNKKNRKKGGE